MSDILEVFQKERTKIISSMLDNPSEEGIYKTTNCFEALDNLFTQLVRHECIMFGGEFCYRKSNPESKMDVPSIVYESTENYYDKIYNVNE